MNFTEVPSTAVRDCKEAANLFNQSQFTVRVTNALWNGPSRLTIDIAYQNTTKSPLSLSGFGNAQMYGQNYALLSDDGTRYVSDQMASMQATMQTQGGAYPSPMQNINPGASQVQKLVFDVPKASYNLLIERQVMQSMTVTPFGGGTQSVSMTCRLTV